MAAYTKSLAHYNGTSADEIPGVSWDLSSGSSIYTSGGLFGSGMLQMPANTIAAYSGVAGISGDLTVEGWFYLNGTNDQVFQVDFFPIGGSGSGGVTARFSYYMGNPYTEFAGWMTDGNLAFGNTTLDSFPSAAWNHYAMVRSGSNFYLWLNGSLFLSGSYGGSIGTMEHGTLQGYFENTVYADEFRVSNTARYTGSFTPPSSEFTLNAFGSAAVTEGVDTASAAGTAWPSFAGTSGVSLSGTTGMDANQFAGVGEVSLSAIMAPALQGLSGEGFLSLSVFGDMIRPDPAQFGARSVVVEAVAVAEYRRLVARSGGIEILAEPSR